MRRLINLIVEAEEEPYIDAHRAGDIIILDMMYVPKAQRGKGVATAYYNEWEKNLPPDIKMVRLWACDAGAGLTTPFWERLGFEYQYDCESYEDLGDQVDMDFTTWMVKGVNGHPTPEPIMVHPDDED